MNTTRDLVEVLVGVLCDRNGFDEWWYNLDEFVQQDILDELTSTIINYIYIPPSEYIM